jgi:hypothetical protein
MYHLKADFAQEIKEQLLNQEYLSHEFIRLRGKVLPEINPACSIM